MKQRVYKESVIFERDLFEFSRCPLRVAKDKEYQNSDLLHAAEETLRVLLYQTWSVGYMSLPDIRSCLDDIWTKHLHRKVTQEIASVLIRVARRLKELLYAYDVLHPVTSYNLGLEKATLEGQYGMVGFKGNKHTGLIIMLREELPLYPDVIDFARFTNAIQETDRSSIRLLNYSVLKDEQKYYDINPKHARLCLNEAAQAYFAYHTFPSPGPYCSNCQTQGCLPN